MDRKQLLGLLGKSEDATIIELQTAYKEKLSEFQQRVSTAPTDALKTKYQQLFDELTAAHPLLIQAQNPSTPDLTSTQMADLPGAMPSYTEGGVTPANVQMGIQIGQILAGRYEIKEQIGQGGMGAVYCAFDQTRQEEVALKVLLPGLLSNDKARERFLTEAKLSSSLSHPNIVNVFDVQNDAGYYFITMELLEGQTLRSYLMAMKAARQPVSVEKALEIANSVCDGLTAAHEVTVHRDLKPENIWLTAEGKIKVMDFGIARMLRTSQLTQTSAVLGTAYYMAPEQLEGAHDVDGRADQYALAVVIYEMLSGSIPAGRFESIRKLRKEVPAGLSNAIDKALSPKREDRFASVSQFGVALKRKGTAMPSVSVGLPKGKLALAAGVLLVAVLIGTVFSQSGEFFKDLMPVSEEVIQAQQSEAIVLQGEVDDLLQRLAQRQKNISQDVKDAESDIERAKTNLRNAKKGQKKQLEHELAAIKLTLKHAEELNTLGERIIFDDHLSALKGQIKLGDVRIKEKDFVGASKILQQVKQDLKQKLQQADNAAPMLALMRQVDAIREQWRSYANQYELTKTPQYTQLKATYREAVTYSEKGELGKAKGEYSNYINSGEKIIADAKSAVNARQKVTDARQLWVDLVKKGYGKNENGIKQEKASDELLKQLQQGEFLPVVKQAEILKAEYLSLPAFSQQRLADSKKLAERKAEQARKERVRKAIAARKAKLKRYAPGLKMINIPAGSFRMGGSGAADEKPVHTVKLKALKLSQNEITFEQYDTYTNEEGKPLADDEGWGRGNRPVINVSWNDVQLYLNWLNKKLKPKKKYRLPTEAEWEYATRAGSSTKYSWGDSITCAKARYGYYVDQCGKQKSTDPVGSFSPNAFGLYDVHGNVWEWVEDCWNGSYHDAPTDGSAWVSGDCSERVRRGGSWYNNPGYLRSASRPYSTAGDRDIHIGFRVAQDK